MEEAVKGTPIKSFPLVPNIKERKPTIKAEPISTQTKSYTMATRSGSSRSRSMLSNRQRKQAVTRHRRVYTSSQQVAPTQTKKRSVTPSNLSPQTTVTSQTKPPISNTLAAPSSTKMSSPIPKAEFALPAPPVSRKAN